MGATAIAPPEQGQLVRVRQRHYVVTDVAKSVLPDEVLRPSANGAQHLVSLASVEDDALGEELQVIWELEPGARTIEKVALPEPTGFDPPERLDAFLDAVRWGAASTADVKNIQAPFRAGIEIEDYQLDPVVRAIQMPRANLLVADDVGLGKTIEAGMVILEMITRHRARRVLVVCPAGLQIQWQNQMRDKFGLDFRIVDSELLRLLRRQRGIHANPWTHFPRLITSIDFLKRERPLRLFRETLPAEGEPLYPRRYDILVLDEAHNVAPSGRGKYATDSLRTVAVQTIAPHFEHKLFLTATPHNGYVESFSALLELLDDQRFARGTLPDKKQLGAVMVRRLKSEFKRFDGLKKFPDRKLEPLEVPYGEEERAVHAALRKYTQLRTSLAEDNTEKFATEFVLKTLKKRLFSCPAAFAATVAKHETSLRSARRSASRPNARMLQRQFDQADEENADDELSEEFAGDAIDSASRVFREPSSEEKALLKQMRDWAATASSRPDAKCRVLIDWLKQHIRPRGQWSDERVIIFTEYRATQKWLQERLAYEGMSAGDERVLTLYGGMDTDQREHIKAAFQAPPSAHAVRILLATDAASEGIDLQNHCHRMVHYEIPWNPNRLEQRNGRIDRHGQTNDVLIHHFVGAGYQERMKQNRDLSAGELEGDLEFLMRAAEKVEAIRDDLGKVGPVIAEQVEDAMLGRRRRLDTSQAEQDAKPVREMLKFERDLQKQVERLREQLGETQRELRLSPENIQHVVEIALEVAGKPPLREARVKGLWPAPGRSRCPVFHLPFLDGSWAQCYDGLHHPLTGEVRPIVFDHALAKGRDDVVLAHLGHRLVAMGLRLLRAEVWSAAGRKLLHRVTARLVPDSVLRDPAMVAHARLVVIGGDCHRLHEEIISAGGLLREGRFTRIDRVGKVQEALAAALPDEPTEKMKKSLLALYPRHVEALAAALTARMTDRTGGLAKAMAERERKETRDIEAILLELKQTIEDKLDDPELRQMTFAGWADPERDQLERNMSFLRERIQQIPGEIERETSAIRQRFANPQPRMFPVAVTFLVPQSMAKS